MAKSAWMGVALYTDSERAALVSWFGGMADGMTPIKANILTRIEDDAELKLRALFEAKDGKRHEMTRTTGRTFTITSKPPGKQPWV